MFFLASVLLWSDVFFNFLPEGGRNSIMPACFFSIVFILLWFYVLRVWPGKCRIGGTHKPKRYTGEFEGVEIWHEDCKKCGKTIAHGNYYGLGETYRYP